MSGDPRDWMWLPAGGRMVAMTHDAYDRARVLIDNQASELRDHVRANRLGMGDLVNQALGVLADHGEVRLQQIEPTVGGRRLCIPVYVVEAVASSARLPARSKRGRGKHTGGAAAAALVLVPPAAAE